MSFQEKLRKRVCLPGTLETSDALRLEAEQLFRNRADSRREVADIDVEGWKLYPFEWKAHEASFLEWPNFKSTRGRGWFEVLSTYVFAERNMERPGRGWQVDAGLGRARAVFVLLGVRADTQRHFYYYSSHFTLPQWILILVLDFSTQNNRKRNSQSASDFSTSSSTN